MAGKGKSSKADNGQVNEPRVIPMYQEAAHIEREIHDHINSIRLLIQRLRPTDRQIYFNGLLSYLLRQEIGTGTDSRSYPSVDTDYSDLSNDDLQLIRELSGHLQRLYLESGQE